MVNKKTTKKSNVFQYAAIVCILFAGGFLANLWITEHYGTYKKIEVSWSQVQFFAAIGSRDIDKAYNVSSKNQSIDEKCYVPRFDKDKHPESVTCKRPEPIAGSCQIAEKIFHTKPTPDCSHQKKYEICKIKASTKDYQVNCTNDICSSNITIGVTDPSKGELRWALMKDIQVLEKQIRTIMAKDEQHGNYGFCFLKCSPKYEQENVTAENLTVASQLLLLPSDMSKFTCKNETVCKKGINVNIIWLDSTSHSHFYRSMPKSVAALRKVKTKKKGFVFNYNLMQSMAGGTYVNTIAFTSGNIVSRSKLLKNKTPIGDLFKLYKNGGYHVAWMDDLCWHWSMDHCACGIPKFLGIGRKKKNATYAASWKAILEKLAKKGVDNTGASLANCEIMKHNNMTDPFMDSKKDSVAICYNGNYQTHYLFASMQMMQSQLSDIKRPFFHFLDLNLGHESSGRRIQTLDGSLAKFVEFLSHQDNTLTLMFGDHGNKYGSFVKASKEAKIEMAHTILFAVASKNLRDKLGKDKLDALEINQNRMVNIFDLRNAILTLAPSGTKPKPNTKLDNHPEGLFFPVSENRTCKSMGITPEAAKCICEQGKIDTSVKNDTEVRLIADFALGVINNKIQEQFKAANENLQMGFGFCNRLVGKWISDVQKTVVGDLIVTDFNIHIPAGDKAAQDEDIFSVVVHVAQNKTNITMELVNYERITTYAVYDKCRDNGVDGDICVCDLDTTNSTNKQLVSKQWHAMPQVVFNQMTTVVTLDSCLFIYERRTLHGLVLETSCDCKNKRYQVSLQIVQQSNVVTSELSSVCVDSGTMTFVCAFHQLLPWQPWYLDYDVKFREL